MFAPSTWFEQHDSGSAPTNCAVSAGVPFARQVAHCAPLGEQYVPMQHSLFLKTLHPLPLVLQEPLHLRSVVHALLQQPAAAVQLLPFGNRGATHDVASLPASVPPSPPDEPLVPLVPEVPLLPPLSRFPPLVPEVPLLPLGLASPWSSVCASPMLAIAAHPTMINAALDTTTRANQLILRA